jgi:hypothetical protein
LQQIESTLALLVAKIEYHTEVIKKMGLLVNNLDKSLAERKWHDKALTNLDYRAAKIVESMAIVTKLEKIVVKNDETLKSMLGWRHYMLGTFDNQKALREEFADMREQMNGMAFGGPSSAGPVAEFSGRQELFDGVGREEDNESVADPETENPTDPDDIHAQGNLAAPVNAADSGSGPEEFTPQHDTVGVPSPDVTMTTATPINSQDDMQETTTLVVAPSIPLSSLSSASHLVPPPPNDVNTNGKRPRDNNTTTLGDRRSPRLGANSRPPSLPRIGPPKRTSQDRGGGESKRQKPNPG